MPAKDRYHNAVLVALVKAGWTIASEQVAIILEERRLWIDILAEQPDGTLAILVEVKGFENTPSPVEYLAEASGKYMLYQASLELLRITTPLYMAVPVTAYHGILSEQIGKLAVEKAAIRLLVFDPEAEEIVQWIH